MSDQYQEAANRIAVANVMSAKRIAAWTGKNPDSAQVLWDALAADLAEEIAQAIRKAAEVAK